MGYKIADHAVGISKLAFGILQGIRTKGDGQESEDASDNQEDAADTSHAFTGFEGEQVEDHQDGTEDEEDEGNQGDDRYLTETFFQISHHLVERSLKCIRSDGRCLIEGKGETSEINAKHIGVVDCHTDVVVGAEHAQDGDGGTCNSNEGKDGLEKATEDVSYFSHRITLLSSAFKFYNQLHIGERKLLNRFCNIFLVFSPSFYTINQERKFLMALFNPVKGVLRIALGIVIFVVLAAAVLSLFSTFYATEEIQITGFALAFGGEVENAEGEIITIEAVPALKLAIIALIVGAVLSLANFFGLTLFRFVSMVGAILAIAAAVVFFLTNELCVSSLGEAAVVVDADSMFQIPGLSAGAAASACLAGIGGCANALTQVLVHK